MNDLVSVIVPVYNTELYVRECIESVINQTYKNWELILIDDGSTDNSGEICEEYKNDKIVVLHQKNGGQSKARNIALKICKGDYIVFLDSDDRLISNALEILYFNIISNNADICCGGIRIFENLKEKEIHMNFHSSVMTGKEACEKMFLLQELDSNTVAKMYRSTLWKNVTFPEGSIFEDVPIMYKIMLGCNRVSYKNKLVYEQRSRDGSTTKSNFTEARITYTKYTNRVYKDIKQNYPELESAAKVYYLYSVADNFIHLCCSENVNDFLNYKKFLKKEIFENRKLILQESVFKDRITRLICCYLGLGKVVYNLKSRLKGKKNG